MSYIDSQRNVAVDEEILTAQIEEDINDETMNYDDDDDDDDDEIFFNDEEHRFSKLPPLRKFQFPFNKTTQSNL
ncbi:hypothetical protein TRFO_15465 [Tritrichomonas foetus]|uniref:Uncharacterized protein n=1 Tax=Tritrichomonas foetus TaxID=1144522 RepID=A0A1J4KX54_9EUKA|nr:hypothetical protein TRFO_15465 [Tritrichomonas foetus]|eukprot:OHT14284.1 hypothetical protein TRFO_15465 [Tritrichomonas foetus]